MKFSAKKKKELKTSQEPFIAQNCSCLLLKNGMVVVHPFYKRDKYLTVDQLFTSFLL